jgi:hypothetical protein
MPFRLKGLWIAKIEAFLTQRRRGRQRLSNEFYRFNYKDIM